MKRTAGREGRPGPFVGPRPFHARERPFLLARDRETATLADAWSGHRLTVLHGDTGVGKTSLVQAGAAPEIIDRGGDVLPNGIVHPNDGFPAAVLPDQNPYTRALVSAWDPGGPPGRSISDLLGTRIRTDRYGRPLPVHAPVDQVELLLRPGARDEYHRRDLMEELLSCLDRHAGLHLLLIVRDDHRDDLRRLLDKYTVRFAEVQVGPLAAPETSNAVDRVLEKAGNRSGPGQGHLLIGKLSAAVPGQGGRGETVDPGLLQIVGRSLWEARPAGARTLVQGPAADTDRALRTHTARVIAETAAECLVSPHVLRNWLDRVLAAGDPGIGAFRGGEDAARVLQDRHLITRHPANGTYVVRHPNLVGPLTVPDRLPEVPRDAAAHLARACRSRMRDDLPVTREHARRALSAQPPPRPRERSRIISLLGDLAFQEGDFPSAARLYQDSALLHASLGEGSAVGRALVAQARCLLLARDRRAALSVLESAAARASTDPGTQTGLGQALWHAGQADSALDVLNRVLARDGANSEARRTRGEILADRGEAASALRDLDRLGEPETPSTRTARALAQATLTGVGTWSEDLDDALTEAADSGPVLLRAARVRRLRGDRDLAARLAARAVSAHHPPLPPHQVSTAARLSEEG